MNAKEILMNPRMKPYGKLYKLLSIAIDAKLLTQAEADAFGEEIDLNANGLNRSHESSPRNYWDSMSGNAKVIQFELYGDMANEFNNSQGDDEHDWDMEDGI